MIVMREPVVFCTLNVRGLNSKKKQYRLSRLVVEEQPDVFAIQETKMMHDEDIEQALVPFLSTYQVCVTHAVGVSAGCFLLLKKSLPLTNLSLITDEHGRFILCDFLLFGLSWRIVCIYAPNNGTERAAFFRGLRQYVECDKICVLLGDFNCVCEPADRSNDATREDSSVRYLKEIVEDNDLSDVGRFPAHSSQLRYTHFHASSHARLDRIYVSYEAIPVVSNYVVKPISFTDHCLVKVTLGKFKKRKNKFNWDLWKFNVNLLKDDDFVRKATSELRKLADCKGVALFESWELFKEEVKQIAIERASVIQFELRAEERTLHENLVKLCNVECENRSTLTKDIALVKAEINQIHHEKFKGAVVRARSEKFLLGEQPTRRALADEKRSAMLKEIREIERNNVIISDEIAVKQAFVTHYRTLFSVREPTCSKHQLDNYLSCLPQLDDAAITWLELPITTEEVESALSMLQSKKSPGPDGLGAEFYHHFKRELVVVLWNLFTEAYHLKALPPSFLRTHTVLLPKSDDVAKLRQVTGYRPITLCNCDYKIYAKILTSRMQTVIGNLVGDHQTCGIKGRSIQANVHIARSILESVSLDLSQVAMLQIDLDKAFDRVQHSFLFAVLSHVKVGHIILEGVRMAYKGCSTRLIINNALTDKIRVNSSVRQGCPLSPLLFALYLEPLCLSIITNSRVHGFSLPTAEVKLLAYADDVAIFCADKKSVLEAVSLTNAFCEISGAVVSLEKCSGLWHGTWATTPSLFGGIHWSTVPSKYLGVPLQCYRNSNTYWCEMSTELQKKASGWSKRDLSIFAKATACNLFLVARIFYVLQVLHCARPHIQKIHRIFATFIWNSSSEPMRRDNLFRGVCSGGLSLTHLFIRQIVTRFCFLRDLRQPFLRVFVQRKLASHLPFFVVSTECCEPPKLFGYWKEVVDALLFLKVRFSMEYLSSVSKRHLVRDLVDCLFPEPLYRSLYADGPGQDVLCRVRKMCVPPRVKSFFYRLHTETLPVKTWMRRRGLFVPWTDNCRLCKTPETIEHVFIYCHDAIFFWDILQRTLKKDLYITPHSIRYLPTHPDTSVPYDTIVLLGLHSIWRSRMADRHADIDIQPVHEYFVAVVAQVKSVYIARLPVPEWICVFDKLLQLSGS